MKFKCLILIVIYFYVGSVHSIINTSCIPRQGIPETDKYGNKVKPGCEKITEVQFKERLNAKNESSQEICGQSIFDETTGEYCFDEPEGYTYMKTHLIGSFLDNYYLYSKWETRANFELKTNLSPEERKIGASSDFTKLYNTDRLQNLLNENPIWVLSPAKKLYVSNFALVESHHSHFLNGGPVLAAGEINIKNSKLVITNKSGHYQPCFECLRHVLPVLENKFGLNLQDVILEDVNTKTQMSVEEFKSKTTVSNKNKDKDNGNDKDKDKDKDNDITTTGTTTINNKDKDKDNCNDKDKDKHKDQDKDKDITTTGTITINNKDKDKDKDHQTQS
jgi:hypothetical protein